MDNYIKRFDEELKTRMVAEIESGVISIREAGSRCRVSVSHIRKWLEEYGKYRPKKDILEVVMKSEEERIRELEHALAEAHLKVRLYGHIIDMADKKYKTDLKKTLVKSNPQRVPAAIWWQHQTSLQSVRLQQRCLLQAS